MARPAFAASLFSVDLVSSSMGISPLRFNPRQHFGLTKAPVFSEPVSRQSFNRSFAHSSVDPRNGNLQHLCYFVDSKKMAFFPSGFCDVVRAAIVRRI